MRLRKLFAIPILALALTGCFRDDLTECNTDNEVTFLFTYSDDSRSAFTDYVSTVDLFLFDGDGYYLTHHTVPHGVLASDPRLVLTLDIGTYYVLSWGNVHSYSAYCAFTPGVTNLNDCLLQIHAASQDAGDQVYYSPYKTHASSRAGLTRSDLSVYRLNVPRKGSVTRTMDFVRAHRTLHVWVKNFEDEGGLHPTIDATKLWSAYDFHYSTLSDRRDYSKRAVAKTMEDVTYSYAGFHHAYGEIDGDVNVVISRTSDGTESATVNVRQFLEDNPDSGIDDIHIMVSYAQDLGVTISLPSWLEKNVGPGID